MTATSTDHRRAVLLACQRGGCILLAEVWLQRGLRLEEIVARIRALEEIRLAHPTFADYDEGIQMCVRDFPPDKARALAADIAKEHS